MAWNNTIFDLTNWKITLPVDKDYFAPDGGDGDYTDDRAYEVKGRAFEGFEAEDFFYYDADQQAMIFRAEADGARTSANTRYTRSELREMDGDDRAAWTVREGGTLSATLKITEIAREDDGDPGRVIIGQIHGKKDELTRLYYNSDGDLYYANERTGRDGDERLFYFENDDGARPNVSLDETFSYVIDVTDQRLTVAVLVDGEIYRAVPTDGVDPTEIISAWNNDRFYFKAGVYQGVNDIKGHPAEGSGATTAAFFDINVTHDKTPDDEAWWLEGDLPDITPPLPPMDGGTADDDKLAGTDASETIKGRGGDDQIDGGRGDDRLWGNDGDDVLNGGAGADWLKGGPGADTYVLDDAGAVDTLADFSKPNGDKIDLTGLLAGQVGFRQDSASEDGFIRLRQDGSDTNLTLRLDGKDVQVAVLLDERARDLSLDDFILPPDTPVPDTPVPDTPVVETEGEAASIKIKGTSRSDTLKGGKGDDELRGKKGNDTLFGKSGDDLLKGGGGNDRIKGDKGDDILWGNSGNDTLIGGTGADWMKGGAGKDIFVFTDLDAVDIIADFSTSQGDMLDLSEILDDVDEDSGDLIADGYVIFEQDGDDTQLHVDLDGADGSGGAVHIATLIGEDASDFGASQYLF